MLSLFSELQRLGWGEPAEILFGSIFNNYIQHQGLVAAANMSSKNIPDFLMRRVSRNSVDARQIYAQPDELLSVIFHVADKMMLDDVVDPYLEEIDHHVCNVFVPSDHTKFGSYSIRNGVNATFQIGYEGGLGVFKISDFRDGWEKSCVPLLNGEPKADSNALRITILLAAFLFPDRVPWLTFHKP